MDNRKTKLLLDKWVRLINGGKYVSEETSTLTYYINELKACIGYDDYFREHMSILTDDVFTLRGDLGGVYVCIEFNGKTAGATFENQFTNDSIFITNAFGKFEETDEIRRKLFNIFD